MVLYKRKSITLPPLRVLPANINIKVWHINETGEWFTNYNEYLERMDFYLGRHFTCEITGTSCLTFFEALNSEEHQFRAVEEKFPLKLREPVAKFLHFNDIRRVDLLVEQVYSKFKSDFYPGERVYLRRKVNKLHSQGSIVPGLDDNHLPTPLQNLQNPYIIKEKASFNAQVDAITKEEVKGPYSKYMITEEFGSKSLMVNEDEIFRDRCTFTKHLIKCFCKITLRRASPKIGAPLCVKDEYLTMYGLTLDWPPSMLQYKVETSLESAKTNASSAGSNGCATQNGQSSSSDKNIHSPPNTDLPETKRVKSNSASTVPSTSANVPKSLQTFPFEALKEAFYYNESLQHVSLNKPGKKFSNMNKLLQVYQFFQTFGRVLFLSPFCLDDFIESLLATDPGELEGYRIKATTDFSSSGHDPSTSFQESTEDKKIKQDIELKCPGICKLLESISNSSVSYKVVKMQNLNDEILNDISGNGTELIVECFVALERLFIDEKGEWHCLVMDQWYDSDEEDDSAESSLKEDNGDIVADEDAKSSATEDDISTPELDEIFERCLNHRNLSWSERLSKRQFKNGNWLIVLLGIFQDCIHVPMYTKFIHKFVMAIVPSESSSLNLAKAMWRNFCEKLSIVDKLEALWILVDITSNYSQDIRLFMEDTMEICVQIRSEKLKISKRLKTETSTLTALNSQLRELDTKEQVQDVSNTAKDEISSKIAAQNDLIIRLNKDKEHLNRKLTENDVRRLNCLGTDRNGNRYYWQEFNGVPTAYDDEAKDFGSGRLWIRGTSKEDAKRILGLPAEKLDTWESLVSDLSNEYGSDINSKSSSMDKNNALPGESTMSMLLEKMNAAGNLISLTPIQRKILDETPQRLLLGDNTFVSIEKPEGIEDIISWLNEGGNLDQGLIRQLKSIRAPLSNNLKKRQQHLQTEEVLAKEQSLRESVLNNKLDQSDTKACREKDEDVDASDEDQELDAIAEEIMALDDSSSKTRTVLNRIRELEERRDYLLNNRTFTSHANRLQSRAQRQLAVKDFEEKIQGQEATLTEYLYLSKSGRLSDKKPWKNELAFENWGLSLYAGASGKAKFGSRLSLKHRVAEIFDELLSNKNETLD